MMKKKDKSLRESLEKMRGKKGNKRERRGTQIKRTPMYAVELIHGRHPTSSPSYPDSVYLFSTHFFPPPSFSSKARVGLTPGKSNIVAAGYTGNLVTSTCWHSMYIVRVYRMHQKSRAI